MLGRVLIVEDDPDILETLAEALTVEGCTVQTAKNGSQALAVLETWLETPVEASEPALIFLDLMMPVMDGWTFLATLRERHAALPVRVVLLSAMRGLSEEARRLEVDGFLEKPFTLEEIVRVARDYAGDAA